MIRHSFTEIRMANMKRCPRSFLIMLWAGALAVATCAIAPARAAIVDEVARRNIFVKGDGRAEHTPSPRPTPAQLVLTGVSLSDSGKVAFLEDEVAGTVICVHVGDSVSNGTIVDISLNSIEYRNGPGKTVRAYVGFDLAGTDRWDATGAVTQPSHSGPRAPGESMDDYLKRRRLEETGH
jgi:hypothetical protein